MFLLLLGFAKPDVGGCNIRIQNGTQIRPSIKLTGVDFVLQVFNLFQQTVGRNDLFLNCHV